ncbi:DMT family transporter [Alphaproteobacteria bacterium KMM 3653]|uniref:DMT family transporter n=2 Tax=Harenicola maris TaxID=2841044 RepID=A0AAP2CQW7_9RHOB|nr:DMT family transporter [Harenicola maris]
MTTAQKPGLENWLILALLGVIWGASFMSVTVALEGFSPFWLSAWRLVIGAVLLLVAAATTGRRLPRWRQPQGPRIWAHLLVFALFTNSLPFALLSWGQTHVPSAFAGVTMAAVPLITLPIAAAFVPGERLTLFKTLGFTMGFFGVLTLIGWGSLLSLGSDGLLAAKFACIGAAACYAIGSVNTRLCPRIDLISFSAAGLLLSALISTGLSFAIEGPPVIPTDASPLLAMGYLGLFPTALATLLLVRVITSAGPSFMSLVNYQVPIWSVIFGYAILSESLPSGFAPALALILCGLGVTQAGQRRLGRYPSG